MHWYYYGDPVVGPPRGRGFAPSDPKQRFLSFVDFNAARTHPNGCLEWTGMVNSMGYGRIFIPALATKNRLMLAHRWAYARWISPIPEGAQVLHRCDNPPCVRPSHLFIGTAVENMADKRAKGRARNQYGPWA
jgi:hypothetical protein